MMITDFDWIQLLQWASDGLMAKGLTNCGSTNAVIAVSTGWMFAYQHIWYDLHLMLVVVDLLL